MVGLPADVPALWLGSVIVATMLVGLALHVPSSPPARAATLAEAIDTVSAAPHPTSSRHPVDAGAVRIRPHRIALRTPDGVSHATLGFGPVTPVMSGSALDEVLRGTPAHTVFDTPRAFRRAAHRARRTDSRWRDPGRSLIVRRVSWGGVNVTLVGV